MEDLLIKIGLTETQAKIYLYLVNTGRTTPLSISKATGITRTNTYKVLDRLVKTGLVSELEVSNKLVYEANDPSSLNNLLAIERNRVISIEESINGVMQTLRNKYQNGRQSTRIVRAKGKKAIAENYIKQIENDNSPLYFIKSRDDIPFMGFETMREIRRFPAAKNILRYGITQDVPESNANPEFDTRTNLSRTWINKDDYAEPVEWSANNSELLITVFEDDGRSIKITDPTIAKAFIALWKLADKNIKHSPGYSKLPNKATKLS